MKNPRILLSGMYGQINVGDEAICYALVKGLRTVYDDPTITIMTHDASLSKSFTRLERVSYFEGECFTHKFWTRIVQFFEQIRNTDIMIVGGGGLFQDIYSWHLPAGSALVAALAVARGIPCFIIGVGIGPIKRRWLRRIIRSVFTYVTHISVRDEESFETLAQVGVSQDHIHLTADLVPSIDIRREFINEDFGEERANVCVAFRKWPGLGDRNFAKLLDSLVSRGYKVQLQCFEPVPDGAFYKNVLAFCSEKTKRATMLHVPKNLKEIITSISQAKYMLSMRYHGCIFAIALNTPLLPVVYESKVGNLIERLQFGDRLKQVQDVGPGLADEISVLGKFWERNQGNIQDRYSQIRLSSASNFAILAGKLEGPQKRLLRLEKVHIIASISILLLVGFLWEIWRILSWPFRLIRKKSHSMK